MSATIFKVDSFAERPFTGNPAAVCILSGPREEAWMQNVAREMNLAETAFLRAREDGFDLRWFTPVVEVELCGHATLASAHVLWEAGVLASKDEARFHTKSGLLTAVKRGDMIELDFPARPVERASVPAGLAEALGIEPRYVGRNMDDYLIEVESEEIVRNVNPDFARLRKVRVRGVIVTAAATTKGFDFVSRFFAPAMGIDEDPVTGAAHCFLGPYWSGALRKREFIAYQVSARGGVVHVRLAGDRVRLGGHAVTILHGALDV